MSDQTPRTEPSHGDILRALSDLKEEVRVGHAQIEGRVGLVQAQMADLRETNTRQWSSIQENSQKISHLLMSRKRGERDDERLSQGRSSNAGVIDLRNGKTATLLAGALLVLALIIAGLSGVDLPRWLS